MDASTIREDLKDAMRAKDQVRVDTLRGALSAFTNELVVKGRKPTDELSGDEMITVLKRLSKQRADAIEQYTVGNRPELAAKETQELEIIKKYLPQMMSRAEVEKVARAKIAELGVTDNTGIGKLTGAVMKECAGRADGNDVREVLQNLLGVK